MGILSYLFHKNPYQDSVANAEVNFRGLPGKVTNWNYATAQTNVENAHSRLKANFESVEAYRINKLEVPVDLQKEFDLSVRGFKKAKDGLGYAEKTLGNSITGMFRSMAKTVGINTDALYSSKIRIGEGGVDALLVDASKVRAGWVESVLGKPFRIVANHSPLALIGLGTAGVIVAANKLHNNAERNTQEDALRQAAILEAQMRQAQMQAPLAQANTIHVPQAMESQFPAAGTQMNQAPSQIMAGNDNAQLMGKIAQPQQQLASL